MSAPVRATKTVAQQSVVMLPRAIVLDRTITPGMFRILAVIGAYDWDGRGNGCTIAINRMASESGTSRSTVKRTLDQLEARGLIAPPCYEVVGGQILKMTIRLTPLARGREATPSAVPSRKGTQQILTTSVQAEPRDQPELGGQPEPADPLHLDDGSNLNPRPGSPWTPNHVNQLSQSKQHQPVAAFSKSIRPEIVRQPLRESDTPRLRFLDSIGCENSEDWLGMFLGIIALRQGESAPPERLREFFDAASASRRLRRAENPLGELLAGLERGYLLANRRPDAPASGASDSLIASALEGHAPTREDIRATGHSETSFAHAVSQARQRAQRDTQPPAVQRAIAALEACAPSAYRFVLDQLSLREDQGAVYAFVTSSVAARLLNEKILPLLAAGEPHIVVECGE